MRYATMLHHVYHLCGVHPYLYTHTHLYTQIRSRAEDLRKALEQVVHALQVNAHNIKWYVHGGLVLDMQ